MGDKGIDPLMILLQIISTVFMCNIVSTGRNVELFNNTIQIRHLAITSPIVLKDGVPTCTLSVTSLITNCCSLCFIVVAINDNFHQQKYPLLLDINSFFTYSLVTCDHNLSLFRASRKTFPYNGHLVRSFLLSYQPAHIQAYWIFSSKAHHLQITHYLL